MGGGNKGSTGGSSGGYSWGGGSAQKFDAEGFNNMLGSDLARAYKQGPSGTFDKGLYTGMGATTKAGLQGLTADAKGARGLFDGVLDSFGATARGENIGTEAPGYQAVRDNLQSDVLAGVGSQFASTGRFGGGSHVNQATRQLTSSLGALDMDQYNRGLDRQVQAAQMLPGLYQGSLAPSQTILGVGQAYDQNEQAKRMSDYELFQRRSDPAFQHLAKYQGLLGAQSAGPQPEQQPGLFDWLGLGIAGAGVLL